MNISIVVDDMNDVSVKYFGWYVDSRKRFREF